MVRMKGTNICWQHPSQIIQKPYLPAVLHSEDHFYCRQLEVMRVQENLYPAHAHRAFLSPLLNVLGQQDQRRRQ